MSRRPPCARMCRRCWARRRAGGRSIWCGSYWLHRTGCRSFVTVTEQRQLALLGGIRRRWFGGPQPRRSARVAAPLLQRARSHAEQAQAPRQVDALQAFPRHAADRARVGRGLRQGVVARDGLEVVEAQLDADGAARVALALQVLRELLDQLG